jgi:transposase-like protein
MQRTACSTPSHAQHPRKRHKSHKSGNVLAALPKSAQPSARAALAEIYNAEDKTHAKAAAKAFAAEFGVKPEFHKGCRPVEGNAWSARVSGPVLGH